MCFFQVEPQAVKMVRQAAEAQRQTVKVNHRAAKTAVTLKQQRRWIFICDALLLCCFNVQTLLYLFNWIWLQCKVVCVKFEVDDVDEAYLKQLLGQFGAIVKIIMLPRMVWHFIFNIYITCLTNTFIWFLNGL